ncbi:heme-binding domain-containing protein [Apibacter sp. HY039]|uniref:heme-binding domain-containing protein n=1 Tax=Apibacter sp. HY039 TaxID=2501476 RepID=UPI000FEBC98E|nr:heme-binding domain-containing protein [Apibacter sp. HY039]
MKKKIGIIIIVILLIQLIRIDKNNPPVDPNKDYIKITHAPAQIAEIIKKACYDCHSNEVKYPWYTNLAPISWYIKGHINEGKEYLNFSEFGNYNMYQKEHINSGLVSAIKRETMPLSSYVWMHKEAELTSQEKTILLNWFEIFDKKSDK